MSRLLNLYTMHANPAKLVGYSARHQYIPAYVWEQLAKNLNLWPDSKDQAGKALVRKELFTRMSTLAQYSDIFPDVIRAFQRNGGLNTIQQKDKFKKIIVNYPQAVVEYARLNYNHSNRPLVWPEGLKTIITAGTSKDVVNYFNFANLKLTPAAKARILESPSGIAYYETQFLANGSWTTALPVVGQSAYSISDYLDVKSNYYHERLPALEPYIIKTNNPLLAEKYIEHAQFDSKISPKIYEILESDLRLLRRTLNNFIRDTEDAGESSIDRAPFVERAAMLLNDMKLALDYVRYHEHRVRAFEPWLLEHAIKNQNADNLIDYMRSTTTGGSISNSVWTQSIPAIVKYTDAPKILDLLHDIQEYDWNDDAIRFLIALEKAALPTLINAFVNNSISSEDILLYMHDRGSMTAGYNFEGTWPEFEQLLRQYPDAFKRYHTAYLKTLKSGNR